MARKDLLKGLMTPQPVFAGEAAEVPAPRAPHPSRGAIGAVSQSIAELKSRSITEIPADMIDDAGLLGRLDEDPEGLDALGRSIRAHGQQVPVLVRHHAMIEGRYEVVYGRRRVAAMKRLGLPVKVMIRNLDDRDLILAQGQENSARKDLTFIEKANFAKQMRDLGYARTVICNALHVDKTVISRMLSVAQTLPSQFIRKIGAAPSVGRDRWLALVAKIEGRSEKELLALAAGEDSDARFDAVLAGLDNKSTRATPKPAQRRPTETLNGVDGKPLGEVARRGSKTVVTLTGNDGFDDWLVTRLDALHRDWLASKND